MRRRCSFLHTIAGSRSMIFKKTLVITIKKNCFSLSVNDDLYFFKSYFIGWSIIKYSRTSIAQIYIAHFNLLYCNEITSNLIWKINVSK